MSGAVIDGRAAARRLEAGMSEEVAQLRADGLGIGLATVVVGDGFSATAYERRLRRLAHELGVPYPTTALPQGSAPSRPLQEAR